MPDISFQRSSAAACAPAWMTGSSPVKVKRVSVVSPTVFATRAKFASLFKKTRCLAA
jgi:hypothetical protein